MPRGRSSSWDSDQSDGPVIIEREPHFVNPFKSRKPRVRIVHEELHRQRRRDNRPEVVQIRGPEPEPEGARRRSAESVHMSGGRPFVELPPRIPDPGPVVPPRPPGPENPPPGLADEQERIIRRERDRRQEADRFAIHETRRRRAAEQEVERARRAAARERERRRQVEDITHRFQRVVIIEQDNRREAEAEARRFAAEAHDAEVRARQAEYALARERELAERERVVRERRRWAELEERAGAGARFGRWPVHIVQRDLPLVVDRGAEVIREAQEAERRRRENDPRYRMERDRYRDLR